MKKRFPIFRYLLLAALLGGAVVYYLFLPKESVFSDGMLGRFAKANQTGQVIPERPLSTNEIFAALADQLQRAGREAGAKIDLHDPQLDSSLPVFAAFSAQLIQQVACLASDSTNVPGDDTLNQLSAEIAVLQQVAERWDGRLAGPGGAALTQSGEVLTARNLHKWSAILADGILTNWQSIRAFERGDKTYSSDNLAEFRNRLQNLASEGQGVNLVFRFDLQPAARVLAQNWLDLCDNKITPASAPDQLPGLLAIHTNPSLPLIIRQYAAETYQERLPIPAAMAGVQAEIKRLGDGPPETADASLKAFWARRLAFVKITAKLMGQYLEAGQFDAELIGPLAATADPACAVETNFVDHCRQFATALNDAFTTEANLLHFKADDLQLCLDKWGQVATQGAFFESLPNLSKAHREPFEKLAGLIGAGATDPSSSAARWQELEQCRASYSATASSTWLKLLFHGRRVYFPLAGDRAALMRDAAQVQDPDEQAWVTNMLAFLGDRDRLQNSVTNFEQFASLQMSPANGSYQVNSLDNHEATEYLALLGKLHEVAAQIIADEDAVAQTVVVDNNASASESAVQNLSGRYQTMKDLLQTDLAGNWPDLAGHHFRKWEAALNLFSNPETEPGALAAQIQSLSRQLEDALAANDPRLPAFIAAVRYQKIDF